MRPPIIFTFRHIDRSYALESHVRDLCHRLQRLGERIMRYHVTLEGPSDGGIEGTPCVVKIELAVPGAQINADSLTAVNVPPPGDIYAAARSAFNNAREQLQILHRSRPAKAHSP